RAGSPECCAVAGRRSEGRAPSLPGLPGDECPPRAPQRHFAPDLGQPWNTSWIANGYLQCIVRAAEDPARPLQSFRAAASTGADLLITLPESGSGGERSEDRKGVAACSVAAT